MGDAADDTPRTMLRRLREIVRSFKIERRMEDEPAHHQRLLEALAHDGAER